MRRRAGVATGAGDDAVGRRRAQCTTVTLALRDVAHLTLAMVRLPGGLLFRAIVAQPEPARPAGPANVRSIA